MQISRNDRSEGKTTQEENKNSRRGTENVQAFVITCKRTSPRRGGKTVIVSSVNGVLGARATMALHCSGCGCCGDMVESWVLVEVLDGLLELYFEGLFVM